MKRIYILHFVLLTVLTAEAVAIVTTGLVYRSGLHHTIIQPKARTYHQVYANAKSDHPADMGVTLSLKDLPLRAIEWNLSQDRKRSS